MKSCTLCLLPRPAEEKTCAICGCEEFGAEKTELGFADRLIGENLLGPAYQAIETSVAQGREDTDCVLQLAWLAYSFRDFRAVEIWCHEGLRLGADSAEPHLLLGLVLARGERWVEAVEEFDAALKKPGLLLERRAVLETLRAGAYANVPEW